MHSSNLVIVSVPFALALFFQFFRELFLIAVLENLGKTNTRAQAFLLLTCCNALKHLSDFHHDCIETLLPNLGKLIVDPFYVTFTEELTFVKHPPEADKMQGKVVMVFVVLPLKLIIKDLLLWLRASISKADHATIVFHLVTRINHLKGDRCYSKHPIKLCEYALRVSQRWLKNVI